MAIPWAPIIGAGASLIGGWMESSAQKTANRTNIQQASLDRAFQERMSSTAWQRGVKDMLDAGMNPMLAFNQGPASSPGGGAARVEAATGMGRGVSSAGSAAMQAVTLENMQLQNQILAEKRQQEIVTTHRMQETYGTGEANETTKAEIERIKADAKSAIERASIARIEREILEETKTSTVSSAASKARVLKQEITMNEAKTLLLQLDIPEKEAIAKWFDTVGAASPAAKAVMSITQWLRIILNR